MYSRPHQDSYWHTFVFCLSYYMVDGYLHAEGTVVQRERVRRTLATVDPVGTASRWGRAINRRVYSVPCPNSLWHMDAAKQQNTPQTPHRGTGPEDDANSNCLICDEPTDEQVIQCDHCDGWVCRQWLPKKYSDIEFKLLTQPEISWNCPSCVEEKQTLGSSYSESTSLN